MVKQNLQEVFSEVQGKQIEENTPFLQLFLDLV